jgi:simple sugar transport system permease protein
MLTNILQLHNITTNVQLVLKGLIIVVTVLLQERNLGELLAPMRRSLGRAVERDNTAPGGVTRTIKEETT